jgi:hypothetical protein
MTRIEFVEEAGKGSTTAIFDTRPRTSGTADECAMIPAFEVS